MGGGAIHAPVCYGFLPFTKNILYMKILDMSKRFVADAPINLFLHPLSALWNIGWESPIG